MRRRLPLRNFDPEKLVLAAPEVTGARTIGVSEQIGDLDATRRFGPTFAPQGGLNHALERNIQALQERRRAEAEAASLEQKIAAAVTRFSGSMRFVYLHLALYGFWILANLGWVPGVRPWDKTFVVLAMIASVEAIFLSTFILITQNRMAALAEKRAELDLQISLLTEHELTKVVAMVDAITRHLGVPHDAGAEVEEMKRNVAPEAVLDAIENVEDAESSSRAGTR